jgi:hydroxymethylbilane synthase
LDAQGKVRIGTRGSQLALWQADHVSALLREAHPGLEVEQVVFTTSGDRFLDRPLAEIGGKGLFTKELEVALLDGAIDLAVHSLKDMPTALPPGLVIGAVPARADVRDCLVTRPDERPEDAAVVGTSSLRRTCLARGRWPNAEVQPIRGNVETRVGRLLEAPPRRVDAVVLAMAGLLRLKITKREDLAFLPLNPERWIPAVGQGALAIEVRDDDTRVRDLLAPLHDEAAVRCTTAERAFLRAVEGDCRVPVAATCTNDGENLRLRAMIGHPETGRTVVHTAFGLDPDVLGAEVAKHVLDAGGAEILRAIRP